MAQRAFDLYPRKCKECGKKFEAGVEYAYKEERQKGKGEFHYFCSWRCLRQYRQNHRKGA